MSRTVDDCLQSTRLFFRESRFLLHSAASGVLRSQCPAMRPWAALFLCVAAAAARDSQNATVVSGYWLVNNKHRGSSYDTWFTTTLRLNVPYVFFYEDEEVRHQVAAARVGLPTHFVRRPLADFVSRETYNARAWVNADVRTAELGMIWLEKVHCVSDAARENVFHTDWFAWVDAGNAAYRWRDIPEAPWPHPAVLGSLPHRKVVYTHVVGEYHRFAGTAFLYHRRFASHIARAFLSSVKDCARELDNWKCGNDQFIFTSLLETTPNSFHVVGQGFGDLVPLLFEARLSAHPMWEPGHGPANASCPASSSIGLGKVEHMISRRRCSTGGRERSGSCC